MIRHIENFRGLKRGLSAASLMAGLVMAEPSLMAQTPAQAFQAAKDYHDGRGVAQDLSVAHELYQRAAAAGSGAAMLNLGYMYHMGEGVSRDYDVARDWYIRAAADNISGAKKNLDMLYSLGLSAPPVDMDLIAVPEIDMDVVPDEQALLPGVDRISDSIIEDVTPSPPPNKALAARPPKPSAVVPISDIPDHYGPLDSQSALSEGSIDQANPNWVTPDQGVVDPIELDPVGGSTEPNMSASKARQADTPVFSASAPAQRGQSLSPLTSLLWPLATALLMLAALLALWRYATGTSRRIVKSFVAQHDYGLRRMYDNFVNTPGTLSNQRIWRAALTDMFGRFAAGPDARRLYPKLAEKLQMDYERGGKKRDDSFAPLLEHAEQLIVKSYHKQGVPD